MVLVHHHCVFGAQLVTTGCEGRCPHASLPVSRLHMWVGLLACVKGVEGAGWCMAPWCQHPHLVRQMTGVEMHHSIQFTP